MLRRPDLRVHDIGHWVAASLLKNGVGVGVASQILGHRDQTFHWDRTGQTEIGAPYQIGIGVNKTGR
jgi:integrase